MRKQPSRHPLNQFGPYANRPASFGGLAGQDFFPEAAGDADEAYAGDAPAEDSGARDPIEHAATAQAGASHAPDEDDLTSAQEENIVGNAMLDAILGREKEAKEAAKLEAQAKRAAEKAKKVAEEKTKKALAEYEEKTDARDNGTTEVEQKLPTKKKSAKAPAHESTTAAEETEVEQKLPTNKKSAAKAPVTPGKKTPGKPLPVTPGGKPIPGKITPCKVKDVKKQFAKKEPAGKKKTATKQTVSHEASRSQYLFRGEGRCSKTFRYGPGKEFEVPEKALAAARKWMHTSTPLNTCFFYRIHNCQ